MNSINYIYIARASSSFIKNIFFSFFAIWLIYEGILTSAQTAIVVSIAILMSRSAIVFAKVSSQFKQKNVLRFNMVIATFSYLLIFLLAKWKVGALIYWAIIAFVIGSNVAVTALSLLSLVAITQTAQHHQKGFAMANIALNIGAGFGPLIGSLVLKFQPDYFPLVPIIFSIITIIITNKFPSEPAPPKIKRKKPTQRKINKAFASLLLINFLTFIGYAQMYDVFPLAAKPYISLHLIGLLFFFSAIIVVVLQLSVLKLCESLGNRRSLVYGNALLLLGVIFFFFIRAKLLIFYILAISLCTLSELFYTPLYRALSVKLYKYDNPVMALAWLSFFAGLGEATATYIGINLVSYHHEGYSFAFAIAAVAIASLLCVFTFRAE